MNERADVFEIPNWSEAQGRVRETARGFARSELMPLAPEIDEKERIPRGLWQRLGKHQLLGVPLPAAHGGQGLSLLCAATVMEELAVACASTAWSVAVHTLLGGWLIARHGTEEQQKRLLPDLCSGRKIAAFALTEPEAGSDAAGVRARAAPAEGAYKVNGTKLYVTNAHLADVLVVVAGTTPEGGRKGLSLLLVERGMKGLTIGTGEKKLGLRGADWGEVRLENVAVPAANRLGPEHGGYPLLREALAAGRLGVAALALGLAEAAFEASVSHASSRRQFGRPIGAFQSVSHALADMSVGLEAGRSLVYHAAQRAEAGGPHLRLASSAKLFATEQANRICGQAVQLLGGLGTLRETMVERYFRDAKMLEIGMGTSQIQREVVARRILGKLE